MKYLVETTGDFMLIDPDGTQIRHDGYSVVKHSPFIQERVVAGQIRTVAEVNDEATDTDWLDYVKDSDGDLDLALASFVSTYPTEGKKKKEEPVEAPSESSQTKRTYNKKS